MQTAEGYYYTDTLGETGTDPIILIHGVGGSHLSWPAAIRKMASRRTIALDLPGHGNSEGSACRSVAGYSHAVQAVMRSARIYHAVFIGYSLGGQIALHYCQAHPDQCAGLGLIASSTEPVLPTQLLDLLDDPAAGNAFRDLVCQMMFDPRTPPNKIKEMERVLFCARKGTLVADWHAFSEYHFPDLEATLTQTPLWFCNAVEDQLLPGRSLRELKRRRQDIGLAFLDDCGHGLLAEQPLVLASAVERALMEVQNSPA